MCRLSGKFQVIVLRINIQTGIKHGCIFMSFSHLFRCFALLATVALFSGCASEEGNTVNAEPEITDQQALDLSNDLNDSLEMKPGQ